MRLLTLGRLACGLLALVLSARVVEAATHELGVEVGEGIVQLTIFDAFTGQPLWGPNIIESTPATEDVRFSTFGDASPNDIVLNGDLFVLSFAPVPCGLLAGCAELQVPISYAWGGDHEVTTSGTFYYAHLPTNPDHRTGPNAKFTLDNDGALDVAFVNAAISGNVNDVLGNTGWTLPYDRAKLCASAACAGSGPGQWFLSAGVSTTAVAPQTGWTGPGERLVPTFRVYGSVDLPPTWLNLTWAVPDLTMEFPSGASLGVDNPTFNVSGTTLTAADPATGWGGVRFNPYTGGTWSNETTVQRVAGDAPEGTLTDAAAIRVDRAFPTFDHVILKLPVPGTLLHGLYVTGPVAQAVATDLTVTGMTRRGVLVNGGARLDLFRGAITGNGGTGVLASGTGTRVYLRRALTGDLYGPQITGNSGGVHATSSAEIRFGTDNASTPGYGYANVTDNLTGRGLSATTGADIYAGSGTVSAGHYQRNRVYGNFPSNSAGNAHASNTGSSIYARCTWWNTTNTALFRVGAGTGAVMDASYYLTSDPYSTPTPGCTNATIDGRSGGGAAWMARGGSTAGRGAEADEAEGLDRLAEAMSSGSASEAVALLASLVADLPDTGAAVAAIGEAGVIAGRAGAPVSAGALLDDAAESEHGGLRAAAWQALVSARRAHGDGSGALAAADALALEGTEGAVQAELARVYLHAEAGDSTAAFVALASLEALAPGTVEAELARAVLGIEAPVGGRGTATQAVEARGTAGTAEVATFTLALSPNPAGTSAAVTLTVAEPSDVTVTVYDLLGRAVATPLAGTLTTGAHRVSLDASALAPGVYVVRASVNHGAETVVQTVRLTVAR